MTNTGDTATGDDTLIRADRVAGDDAASGTDTSTTGSARHLDKADASEDTGNLDDLQIQALGLVRENKFDEAADIIRTMSSFEERAACLTSAYDLWRVTHKVMKDLDDNIPEPGAGVLYLGTDQLGRNAASHT